MACWVISSTLYEGIQSSSKCPRPSLAVSESNKASSSIAAPQRPLNAPCAEFYVWPIWDIWHAVPCGGKHASLRGSSANLNHTAHERCAMLMLSSGFRLWAWSRRVCPGTLCALCDCRSLVAQSTQSQAYSRLLDLHSKNARSLITTSTTCIYIGKRYSYNFEISNLITICNRLKAYAYEGR